MELMKSVEGLRATCPDCKRTVEVNHYGDEGGSVSYCCGYEFHSDLRYIVDVFKQQETADQERSK